jgi:1,4-alpha-glucan branching enzyme
MKRIEESDGGVDVFTQGFKYFGLHIQSDNTVLAREWAPGAEEVFLTGDFSEY